MLIVSYYPGAGGFRYLRSLRNIEFSVPGITYDKTILRGIRTDSHMLGDLQDYADMMVTHCVNVPLIRSRYMDATVVQLRAPLRDCLRREWMLAGRSIYSSRISSQEKAHRAIDSAFTAISWHSEYYQKYPMQVDDDTIMIDIATAHSEFGKIMRDELLRYQSPFFDLAWQAFSRYGHTAPIIDIFEASALANRSDDLGP